MKNKLTRTLSIIFGVIFGGIIIFNIAKKIIINYLFTHYVPPAISVSSDTVKTLNYHPLITAFGNFVAANGIEVGTTQPGIISKIHFRSGQYINKGAPLIDLEDAAELADLKLYQADLVLQQAEFKRQKELQLHNATALANVDKAQANLLQAQARVDKVSAILKQKHITAPFAGFLGIRHVDLGEYIKPGETSIVSLQSLDPIYLRFFIPEHLLNKLQVNQPINFSVEEYPKFNFVGKISAISSKSDENTHNIEVQAIVANCPSAELNAPEKSNIISIASSLINHDKKIIKCSSKINKTHKVTNFAFLPGSYATIKIVQPLVKNILVVPSTAISFSRYGDSVYVIEKNQTKYFVKKVFVTLGEQLDNYTIIKSGLKPGQIIVSSGEFKLEDGNEVHINNSVQLPVIDSSKIGH